MRGTHKISKLWLQTCSACHCPKSHFVHTYAHNSNTTVVYGCCTYWMTALLSMSIFWVRAPSEIRLASYGSKHASQCLYNVPFVYTYMHTCNLKLQVIYGRSAYWITALLSETFLVWFRVAWEIWLESYGSRHTLIILWYNIVMHILQACTYVDIWCATMYDNKPDVAYDCTTTTTHQMTALLPTTHCFIRTNLANYSTLYTLCSVFPITVDTIDKCTLILKLIIRNTIALLDKLSEYAHAGALQWFCCQVAKKIHKLGVKNFL